jgi:hypothetical protein
MAELGASMDADEKLLWKIVSDFTNLGLVTRLRRTDEQIALSPRPVGHWTSRGSGAHGLGYASDEEIFERFGEYLDYSGRMKTYFTKEKNLVDRRTRSAKMKERGITTQIEYHLKQIGKDRGEELLQEINEELRERERDEANSRLKTDASWVANRKVYAEKNPDDPLSWLILARTLDEFNCPREAERYRMIAIDLIVDLRTGQR